MPGEEPLGSRDVGGLEKPDNWSLRTGAGARQNPGGIAEDLDETTNLQDGPCAAEGLRRKETQGKARPQEIHARTSGPDAEISSARGPPARRRSSMVSKPGNATGSLPYP